MEKNARQKTGDFVAGMFVGSQMEKNRTNNNTNTGTSQASNSTAGSNESTYSGCNNNYTSAAQSSNRCL